MRRWRFASVAILALAGLAATLHAQAPATERPKLVAPVKGEARIGHLRPDTKVVGNEVVTVFQIKNLMSQPIAGLKIEEFWYDKTNNLVPGASETVRKPIQPNEVVTVTLRTPKDARMSRNTYRFSHANGAIKPELMKTLK
ncbi:MAG TPA: hypothetical protein VH701_04680 [Vicinamibacterales bacterium]